MSEQGRKRGPQTKIARMEDHWLIGSPVKAAINDYKLRSNIAVRLLVDRLWYFTDTPAKWQAGPEFTWREVQQSEFGHLPPMVVFDDEFPIVKIVAGENADGLRAYVELVSRDTSRPVV